jgi:predicted transposase/invertase (TIGR01784 family)
MSINRLGKYINLFTDFGFKRIFGTEKNKDLLIDFLNTLLEKEISPIQRLTYLNNERLGKQAKDRKAFFDLYCENQQGEKFIIELQKAEQAFFKDRSIYYATFPIQEQALKGKWNYELTPVYTISIMNFIFDNDFPEQVISRVELRERDTNRLFFDKLKFVYIEIPKFHKKNTELQSNLDKWLYVFRNMHQLEKMPNEVQQGVFLKLFKECEIAQYKPKELMEYEQSWKELNDMFAVLSTAEKKGERIGIEKGERIGIEKGERIGIEKGERIGIEKIAINAIKKGFDNVIIQELTGLDIASIERIRKNLNK